jgi:predicted nucleic acid-binding protein
MKIRLRFLVLAIFPASLAAQASLWTRVVALPTGCYSDSDTMFLISVTTSKEALDAEITRQEELNTTLSAGMNPATMSATMQAAMMKDPQGATKVLQAVQEVGTEEYQTKHMNLLTRHAEMLAQFEALKAELKAALAKADAALAADMAKYYGGGESVQQSPAETKALLQKWETLHAPVCAQYFKAGAFPKWLASYKAFLVNERVPFDERGFAINKDMLTFYGIDTRNYRSTVAMTAVSHYLDEAYKAYALRPHRWNP